jgi:probable F420-dependent oxidoreductase
MKIDAALWVTDLSKAASTARAAEEVGFDALWTSDIAHNPLFPLVLAAPQTERIKLGTAILVAFARSPMDVAYQAWDLAQLSRGRFLLGLGTQVRAHIERRFGMTWEQPAAERLRDYVLALRAIWHSWQNGERLNYRGDFYKLTLMTPFFDPGPIEHPHIPIYTAGVNERMCRLAGEVSDGFHAHPFHTRRYLEEVVIPAIEKGAETAGRRRADIALSSAVFVATGRNQDEMDAAVAAVRQQVSFYASTPDYAAVMDLHGWSAAREDLSRLASRKQWADMPALVTDEMVDAFAVVCAPQELSAQLRAKYEGVLDRITLYMPFDPKQREMWKLLIDQR